MNYIHQPGDPQGRPTYIGREVLMQGGVIAADKGRLEAHCDAVLNHVDPDVRFRVVGHRVLYSALYAERMSSDHPEDKLFGSVPEMDIGLWILVWGGRSGDLPGFYWLPMAIFVDSTAALMTGRELYGYPKQFGRIVRRTAGAGDFSVTLGAVSFMRRDASEIAREHEVLRVESRVSQVVTAVHDNAELLLDGLRQEIAGDVPDAGAAALLPPFVGMPMVFLRQMRDATAIDAAIVREIVTVTVKPTTLRGVGVAGGHTLILNDLASYPLREITGCGASTPIEHCFWAEFDFVVGTARKLA